MRLIDFLAYFKKPSSFITKHNLYVATNGYNVSQEDVEKITENTILEWQAALNWIGTRHALEKYPSVVFFCEKPFTCDCLTGKLNGLYIDRALIIGYDHVLERTSLRHEIGHLLHASYFGNEVNAEKSHKFMLDYGLY